MKEGTIQLDQMAANQPRILFKPGSWFAKIDFINHLILFNNVLITVLSEKEGGKTSFSTLLQNNLDQQIKSISMTVKPLCDRESVINDIATQLHLNNDDQIDIASIVAQVNEHKAHVLLVIDDAQNLPESLIKEAMLAIKNQDASGFFHLCLVSDYSVIATLNSLADEQFNNLIHTIELGSLNESETRTYVLQRAMSIRLINKPLSDAQFKQFYQLTKGNLAKINSNLESFILNCPTEKKSNKMLHIKRASLAIIAAAVVGVSYMYFDDLYNKHPITDLVTAASTTSIISIPKEDVLAEQLISYIASWQDSSTRQIVHYALPKKQILDGIEDEDQTINTVALVDKVVVIPTVKVKDIKVKDIKVKDIKVNNVEVKNILVKPIAPVVPKSKLVAFKEPMQNKLAKKPIIKQNTSLFTIQVTASHHISDVARFRKNNNLMNKTIVRQFTNAKGTWYVLTIGEFDNKNRAQSMATKLPAYLVKLKPWVRSVSGLSNVG